MTKSLVMAKAFAHISRESRSATTCPRQLRRIAGSQTNNLAGSVIPGVRDVAKFRARSADRNRRESRLSVCFAACDPDQQGIPMQNIVFVLTIFAFTALPAYAQDHSSAYTADYQRTALEIFRDIISMRSAEGHGKVPEVANYLAERFRAGGFDKEDVHVLPLVLSSGEGTASLVVRYRGDDSAGRKPILLIAHMDVVEALPEDWERDPYTLVEEDGYFFGRGTLDNKFGITMLTTNFLRLKAEGFTPTRDLIIAFSGDEETNMETIRDLVTTHRDLIDAEYVLNADGGSGLLDHENRAKAYYLQAAEKAYASFELTVRNPGGHSSMPRKDNAIYELATALKAIEAYAFPAMINDATRKYFQVMASMDTGEAADAMRRFASNPTDEKAVAMISRDPAKLGLIRTTCVATMLSAGHAENALPQSASATINCRIFPGVSFDSVKEKLREVAGVPGIEVRMLDEPRAGPASELDEEVVSAVSDSVHARYPGIPIIPYMAAYATDGRETRLAGMPTYGVMGLFIREEDEFSHGLNERVPVREFYGALEHWYRILHTLAGQ
jgi:acetylornithine deacetylase/succinyl-diaminopimelate desuccinylase-like protein